MPSQPKSTSASAQVRLFPRRKLTGGGEVPEKGRAPLKVDLAAIKARFGRPQSEAAQAIGISLTALKQICRKLGIQRWPYQRPCKSGRKAVSASPMARAAQPAAQGPRHVAPPHADAAAVEHLSESEESAAEMEEEDEEVAATVASPIATSALPGPEGPNDVKNGCHADDGLCPPASAASSDASYYCHQRGDTNDLLTLQLQVGCAADNDEGDDLSWMAVEIPEHELSYDRNWQPYYYAVASAPVQKARVYERCETTPLFGPGEASGEFSRVCGDALQEAMSAQATAHNSPVSRPSARLSPMPHLCGMDLQCGVAPARPRVAKIHSDDLAYAHGAAKLYADDLSFAPPVGMACYARPY